VSPELPIISDELLALPAQQTLVLSPSDRARRAYEQVWVRATLKSQSKNAAVLPRFSTTKLWFAQLWEEAQLFGLIDDATAVISSAIERALWCHVVESIAQTTSAESNALADRMMEAWMLEQSYGDGASVPFAIGSSGDMYRAARSRFMALLKSRDAMTAAQLPAWLIQHAEKIRSLVPQYIVQTPSFAPLPSEQRAIKALVSSKGAQLKIPVSIAGNHQRAKRTVLPDPSEERDAAIEWTQRALADANAKSHDEAHLPFAIVVPDLKQTRGAWQRRLSASGTSFNLSLGLPVSAHPWAAAGFTLVSALAQPMPVETISQALRHSRWGHSRENSSTAYRPMQSGLKGGNNVSLLSTYISIFPRDNWAISDRVDPLVRELSAQPARRSRMQWRAFFERAIAAFTSQEHALSSEVFQLRQSLMESIETWQSLDEWLPTTTMLEAQQELIAITDQAAFQPEGSDAPLQVIGLLESAGVPFHGMWITSMTEHTLPEASRSNPFLNARWQREARAGLSNIDECDDRATRLVNGWSSLSAQVIASRAERVDGEPQVWSPLVSKWSRFEAVSEIARPATPTSSAKLVALDDERAPAWRAHEEPRHASVRAMESQALCPRRGFAAGRLKLDAWPEHFDGLSPLVRGNLVHAVAESLGRLRKSQTHDEEALHDALPLLVNDAISVAQEKYSQIAEHVWTSERERLIRVWNSLLEKEVLRRPFTVLHVEEDVRTQIGDLNFSLRMDRVDKFDAVDEATGEISKDRLVVIDFKSGNADRNGLLDERLTAPQLPLYAHALGVSSVDAAVYARVSDDAQDFAGLGTKESGFAQKKNSTNAEEVSWETIRDGWSEKLATLANELIAGEAALAPAYGEATCNRCDFSRFCRVDFQALSQIDDVAESEEGES
jgi:ATP-dependent helicase/nuclease subunit B